MSSNKYNPEYKIEYETLRKEIETDKKYVFERPILIFTVSIATLNLASKEYLPYIPAFITIILFFNFSFTVNRLFSAARIIAYIMLVIEKNYTPYIGWENLLYSYRRYFIKIKKKRLKKILKAGLKTNPPTKGYGFYPIIYSFHIFIFLVTYLGLFLKTDKITICTTLTSVLTSFFFIYLLVKYNNRVLRRNIVYEKIKMELVIKHIK